MKLRDPRAAVLRGFLIALGLLPLLPRAALSVPALRSLAALAEHWFAFQCERDPARTLSFGGNALPVCARCFGIYLGIGLGALVLGPRLAPRSLRLWLAAASLLMLADVVSELLALRPAWAPLRLLSGALLSYPVSAALVLAARVRWPRAELRSRTPNRVRAE